VASAKIGSASRPVPGAAVDEVDADEVASGAKVDGASRALARLDDVAYEFQDFASAARAPNTLKG
jgi:hypothetical protein